VRRSDRVEPLLLVAVAAGQVVQIGIERFGRLERHGLGERTFEVMPMVATDVVGQPVERTGQTIMMVFVHFRRPGWRRFTDDGTQQTRDDGALVSPFRTAIYYYAPSDGYFVIS